MSFSLILKSRFVIVIELLSFGPATDITKCLTSGSSLKYAFTKESKSFKQLMLFLSGSRSFLSPI